MSPPQPSTNTGKENDMQTTQLPPLLFLVGEQRRDIIPKTLTSPSLPPDRLIQVDELVVYETGVMESFPTDLDRAIQNIQSQSQLPSPSQPPPPPPVTETGSQVPAKVKFKPGIDIEPTNQPPGNTHYQSAILAPTSTPETSPETPPSTITITIIIIFSPSGCSQLLHRLALPHQNRTQAHSTDPGSNLPRTPVPPPPSPPATNYITITIGPTTYAYLQSELGFTADACAETPSPAGVGKAVEEVLGRERGVLWEGRGEEEFRGPG